MNKKQTALLAGLLGAGVLAASAKFYMDVQEDRQKAAALKQVRAFFADFTFVRVDRDDYMALAQKWDIFGIPSFVVLEKGQEIGRFVDKNRKTKTEITSFLAGLK